jgi:hypothetical protein
MISTVTTTTVSTVTTATVAVLAGLALLAILTLLGLLVTKEIVSSSDHPRLQQLSRVLNVAIIPLLMGFLVIAVVKVLEVL